MNPDKITKKMLLREFMAEAVDCNYNEQIQHKPYGRKITKFVTYHLRFNNEYNKLCFVEWCKEQKLYNNIALVNYLYCTPLANVGLKVVVGVERLYNK